MRTSARDWTDFAKSPVWLDMSEELNVWINDLHQQMENPELSAELWRRLQGNIEAIRNVLNMPLILAENLKAQEEEENDREWEERDG